MQKEIIIKLGGGVLSNTPACLKQVYRIVESLRKKGNKIVMVVSAMGNLTDELRDELGATTDGIVDQKMLDFMWATGEMKSVATVANYLIRHGVKADCFTGGQAGILADYNFGDANIVRVDPENIKKSLRHNDVAVAAGFQASTVTSIRGDEIKREIVTLGRNGSERTTFAIMDAMSIEECIIYKDVTGVFNKDPKKYQDAQMYKFINYRDVLTDNVSGIIQEKALRSLEAMYDKNENLRIYIRNFYNNQSQVFTTICNKKTEFYR